MPLEFSEQLSTMPLDEFLDQLGSSEPAPGGGSAAALGGALAAALLSMVCRLTIGKKGYESVEPEMHQLLARIEPLGRELRNLMQADIDAYNGVMNAYKLPKLTDEEKQTRTRAVQAALKHASEVPLRVAELCAALIDLARPIAEKGNRNAISDAGVGVLMAEAGLRGAALNVSINLASIQDQPFVNDHRRRLAQLLAPAAQQEQEIIATVEGRL
jgi:formiminotetrahydrofolate cyclodeaminase